MSIWKLACIARFCQQHVENTGLGVQGGVPDAAHQAPFSPVPATLPLTAVAPQVGHENMESDCIQPTPDTCPTMPRANCFTSAVVKACAATPAQQQQQQQGRHTACIYTVDGGLAASDERLPAPAAEPLEFAALQQPDVTSSPLAPAPQPSPGEAHPAMTPETGTSAVLQEPASIMTPSAPCASAWSQDEICIRPMHYNGLAVATSTLLEAQTMHHQPSNSSDQAGETALDKSMGATAAPSRDLQTDSQPAAIAGLARPQSRLMRQKSAVQNQHHQGAADTAAGGNDGSVPGTCINQGTGKSAGCPITKGPREAEPCAEPIPAGPQGPGLASEPEDGMPSPCCNAAMVSGTAARATGGAPTATAGAHEETPAGGSAPGETHAAVAGAVTETGAGMTSPDRTRQKAKRKRSHSGVWHRISARLQPESLLMDQADSDAGKPLRQLLHHQGMDAKPPIV